MKHFIRTLIVLWTLWAGLLSSACGAVDEFGFSTLAANSASRTRLNIFGEGEARGFLDVSTNATFANGRPLTSGLASGSADDIFMRFSPLSGENTISEIMRLSKPGTRITILNGSQKQGALLREAFGDGAETVLERTFRSQTVAPGEDLSILKLLVK